MGGKMRRRGRGGRSDCAVMRAATRVGGTGDSGERRVLVGEGERGGGGGGMYLRSVLSWRGGRGRGRGRGRGKGKGKGGGTLLLWWLWLVWFGGEVGGLFAGSEGQRVLWCCGCGIFNGVFFYVKRERR